MRPGTYIAMIFLVLIAIAHFARAITGLEIVVGEYYVPLWMSWAAMIFTAVLAILMRTEHHTPRHD